MTQYELILHYLTFNPFIIPAKMVGKEYVHNGVRLGFCGSDFCKRCRDLRSRGLLVSEPDPLNPKFTRFFKPSVIQGKLL